MFKTDARLCLSRPAAIIAFFAVLLLPFASRAPAQATPLADMAALKPGSVEGRIVFAKNGQPAADASIRLDDTQTIVLSATDGRFLLASVAAGTHSLLVELDGHAPVRVIDVAVRPGQKLYLDALLLSPAPEDASVPRPAERVMDGSRLALVFPYKRWTVTGELFAAGPEGSFDEIAVKNPSIVFHGGQWHLFYTSKPRRDSREFKTALGYARAPAIEGLGAALRVEMRQILGESIIAPQVFYFEPQKLWYLIGHLGDTTLQRLEPVYSTNPDISNVEGWSAPRRLQTNRKNKDNFWIDFWVICDEQKAHLFYSDHSGTLYRMETAIADFPLGFVDAAEQPVVTAKGRNDRGAWRFYDACHIYHVKSANKYLALLEGAYAHPTRRNQWDGRNRFMLAMISDRLEGPWQRVEARDAEFMGESRWLFDEAGAPVNCDSVSHPELIRAGNDQRLQIEDYRLQMLFQTFDAKGIKNDYDYHALPWRLMLMRNY